MTRFLSAFSTLVATLLLSLAAPALSQVSKDTTDIPVMDYSRQETYTIGGITVSGVNYLDRTVLISLSGLSVGDRISIPGEEITRVVKKFWEQGLFSDVKITVKQIDGDKVYLDYYLQERPRLGKLSIVGLKKAETTDIQEKLKLRTGSQITEDVINNISIIIKKHFIDKGFFNTQVKIFQLPDTALPNRTNLKVLVDKNSRVKIADIIFTGDSAISEAKLRKTMKKTHRRDWNIFKSSKFIRTDYKEDKEKVLALYNEKGYRDAKILRDSFSILNPKRVILYIDLYEGPQYYFRNINWVGNTIYPSEYLAAMLGIKKGDVYDQTLLNKRLMEDEDAVSNLYLDNGYLFFNLSPEEVLIQNDSIDVEMRMSEGKQATINSIIINGNTKTNEHVIRREIRTLPGELFNRSEIIRTVRELAQLGHFDPEKIEPKPIPNPAEGTVDIQYNLEERSNDQLEVSGGWGAGMLVGTIGLRFSNFSARNALNLKSWRPIPSGDGQTLSIRAQSNGSYYRNYSISFVEPWLGGKKPNSLSVSIYNSKYRNGRYDYNRGRISVEGDGYMAISGASVGIGQRLTWPDDFFTLYNEFSIQRYDLKDYERGNFATVLKYKTGTSNNFAINTTLGRNSMDQTIYPRKGSNFALTLALTPPYSLITGKEFKNDSIQEKYKWVEYYKWSFKTEWYLNLVDKLVLFTRGQFGFKGYYNKDIGQSPFEGYYVGGDGMVGYNYYGYEVIPLRGYSNNGYQGAIGALTPPSGANYYTKYTAELRYPISLNPQATVFALTFLEAGNAWVTAKEINPFAVRRSAGVGLRAFLPMFGMLGIDWGYGFDKIPWLPNEGGGQFHFTIGQQF
jgi:outer membrane protein insertion porin family